MEIKGIVESVIFHNEENGYGIIGVDCNNEYITAVGTFPPLAEGECVCMQGDWIVNAKFGEQFKVDSVKIEKPNTKDSIEKYLSSGLFNGVGVVTARNIVNQFGVETLDIIEFEPLKLTKLAGISSKKALALSEKMKQLKDMQATILYMQELDITLNCAIKIYRAYEGGAIAKIIENPYQLVEDVDGIGFVVADKIAQKLGMDKCDRKRISVGINYVLQESTNKSGNTYISRKDLCREVRNILQMNEDMLSEINAVVDTNMIKGSVTIFDDKDNNEIVMLSKSYVTELSIASKLAKLLSMQSKIMLDCDRDIAEYQDKYNINLHDDQIKAIKNCLSFGVNVITGGPGTGKTTIIKCIIDIIKSQRLNVCLCAPTGRASKRLSLSTGEEAKTIHRLLDLDFKNGKGFFTYNDKTRLDYDVVIIDEVSMCDEYVFNSLISAIKVGGQLIMVGDKDQLPSVGAGNVLADIIASECIPINYLTHIYRQGDNSNIVVNAHKINNGEMPIVDNKSKDFFYSKQNSGMDILSNVISMATTRLPKFTGLDIKDFQILCPMKRGVAGVENINIEMQKALNPHFDKKTNIQVGTIVYKVGDKIIHLVNNYQMEWVGENNSVGTGVYNGDIGYIIEIDSSIPVMKVKFEDGKIAQYKQGDFDQISLAYAISIHKSQGSEFEGVIIALNGANGMIMTRNLLYTAVTRAKKIVVIVGDDECMAQMIKNNYTTRRNTMLDTFLKEQFEKK